MSNDRLVLWRSATFVAVVLVSSLVCSGAAIAGKSTLGSAPASAPAVLSQSSSAPSSPNSAPGSSPAPVSTVHAQPQPTLWERAATALVVVRENLAIAKEDLHRKFDRTLDWALYKMGIHIPLL